MDYPRVNSPGRPREYVTHQRIRGVQEATIVQDDLTLPSRYVYGPNVWRRRWRWTTARPRRGWARMARRPRTDTEQGGNRRP